MRPMLCTAVLLLALVGCGERPSDQTPRFELGKPAPPLSVERIVQPAEGATATWASLRGKVVVLEFWATWCGPCVAAIAHLNELADTFKDRPVQFIAVTDEKEAPVQQFLARKPMRAWVGLDTDRSMFRDYRVSGIPRTIVVDARGIVVGDTYPTVLSAAALENVLAGRPTGLPEPRPEAETVAATKSAFEESAPPLVEVTIRRRDAAEGQMWSRDSTGWEFSGCGLRTIIELAYDVQPYQILLPGELSSARFDAKAEVAGGRGAARPLLQSALMSVLGLTLRRETRPYDGYRLVVPTDGTHKLVPTAMEADACTHSGSGTDAAGMMNYTLTNQTIATLCATLGRLLDCPVRDDTHLEGRFDFLLVWKDGDKHDLLRAVREQLGLELQPERQTVEMLIFEPVPQAHSAVPAPTTAGVSDAPHEFKTPAQVIAEAIEAQALVAIVRQPPEGELAAALRDLWEHDELTPAGEYFLFRRCITVLTIDEWITRRAVLPNTVYLLDACGGGAAQIEELLMGNERPEDRYKVVIYPTFRDGDNQWLVFCRPAVRSDFDEEGVRHFAELLRNKTFCVDPPNVFVLADRRAGLVISDDPQSVDRGVWSVPSAFVSDLKALLLSSGVAVQTDLAREVLMLRAAEKLAGPPENRAPTR